VPLVASDSAYLFSQIMWCHLLRQILTTFSQRSMNHNIGSRSELYPLACDHTRALLECKVCWLAYHKNNITSPCSRGACLLGNHPPKLPELLLCKKGGTPTLSPCDNFPQFGSTFLTCRRNPHNDRLSAVPPRYNGNDQEHYPNLRPGGNSNENSSKRY